jgi:hypothetical protein
MNGDYGFQDETKFSQWPDNRPRPTAEEYAAARDRYHKSITDYNLANPGNPDTTDFCCGLDFVMATYNRWIWWPFFFPDDPPVDPHEQIKALTWKGKAL